MPASKTKKPPATIRGVAALFGDDEPDLQQATNEIDLSSIEVGPQPRRYFDQEKLQALVVSVREKGILEPLLVRPLGSDRYQLVAGERRYRAAVEVGLQQVPAIIKELSDLEVLEVALIENLQREDLNPLEETEGLLQLMAIKCQQDMEELVSLLYQAFNAEKRGGENTGIFKLQPGLQVLESMGVNWQSFVQNRLPLLNLPADVLEVLRQGRLEYTKARAIARVKDAAERQALLQDAIELNLSRTQIKERIAGLRVPPEPNPIKVKMAATLKQLGSVGDLSASKQAKIEEYLDKIQRLLG